MEENVENFFVSEASVVRKIWGKADNVLFIFAGASAEFALNRAVDWLYFTGRLPSDPLGRLFSTVDYSRKIIFSERSAAHRAIDQITGIHKGVEASRGAQIPDSAYLEVLYMLIDYSVRAYELLERKLNDEEKNEVFDVFHRMGRRMQLVGLPATYNDYLKERETHLRDGLYYSRFTPDLYKQYKKHLGAARYLVLKQAQVLVVPQRVNQLLKLGNIKWLQPVVYIYKVFRLLKMENMIKTAILPPEYLQQVKSLDITI